MWVPSPAVDNVALDQLMFAKSKRVMSTHLFIVQMLFCTLLQHQSHKEADVILLVPSNTLYG